MASKCVRTSPGYWVSFDQESHLMDRDLLSAVRGSLQDERTRGPGEGLVADEQWIWARYCELHRERYNDQFLPDRDPCWDFPALEQIRAMRDPPDNPSVFVTSSHGFRVDFEKACLEMDPAVLAQAKREMQEESTHRPVPGDHL